MKNPSSSRKTYKGEPTFQTTSLKSPGVALFEGLEGKNLVAAVLSCA
jgi:hypothetical protein